MQRTCDRESCGRGELVRLLYRLGHRAASGVVSVAAPGARPEVLVLRRGAAVCADGEPARRALASRLARWVAEPALRASFDGGVAACPPGALHQLALASWVCSHLEAQLDRALAERVVRELTGSALALCAELAPVPRDDADRRMLAALDRPRRLDQIWPLARVPRFRLLGFVHFLRAVGAITADSPAGDRRAEAGPRVATSAGGAAPAPPAAARPPDPRLAAIRLLGLLPGADAEAIKRAYRRLARTWHPDLSPGADDARRRLLERRFAELTDAYEALQ